MSVFAGQIPWVTGPGQYPTALAEPLPSIPSASTTPANPAFVAFDVQEESIRMSNPVSGERIAVRPPTGGCLLYTSDAADE